MKHFFLFTFIKNFDTTFHMNTNKTFISIKNCRIENNRETIVENISWEFKDKEAWLVIGPNGGGKADFLNGLTGLLKILPNPENLNQNSLYSNIFSDSVEIVSLERAAHLIQEERENDESDYVEGGVDIGRIGRVFITEGTDLKADEIDENPAVKLCGIEKILDRGLKYMSTGEIRRTLLAKALISKKELLVLSDPFAGLDVQSRGILLNFFDSIVKNQLRDVNSNSSDVGYSPKIILGMERWHEIPENITNVIEFADKKVNFCGSRKDYEKILAERENATSAVKESEKIAFESALNKTMDEQKSLSATTDVSSDDEENSTEEKYLIEMNNVNVGWDDHRVLVDLNWKLKKGEHWLIQGPNGSGKTTFLELITGDNMQVFCNDVRIFGNRRGSGETIWDIKKKLGIVSYRLHVEYRMLGGTSLLSVIISGFRDSIGLYETPSDWEIVTAKKWLALGGFEGRESTNFGDLSYGEQRAILILRSAVKCPEILILDEPCHGLDEKYREKILQLMELIGNGNTTTMLHVTHDPSEILQCEKHVLLLKPNESPMYECIEKK